MHGSTDSSSREVARCATQACERLSHHLSSLVGEHGINTLFKRSALLAKKYSPWLANKNPWAGAPRDAPWLWLHATLEQQESAVATEGFILVLATVGDLLENLIGKVVVNQLLEDAWPAVFPEVRGTREPPS